MGAVGSVGSARSVGSQGAVGAVGSARSVGAVGAATICRPVSAALPPDFFNRPLAEVDPEIAEVLAQELERQQSDARDDRLGELRHRRRCSNARARC